ILSLPKATEEPGPVHEDWRDNPNNNINTACTFWFISSQHPEGGILFGGGQGSLHPILPLNSWNTLYLTHTLTHVYTRSSLFILLAPPQMDHPLTLCVACFPSSGRLPAICTISPVCVCVSYAEIHLLGNVRLC